MWNLVSAADRSLVRCTTREKMYSTSRGITARSSTTPSGRKLWTRSVTLGKRLFAMLLLLFCRFFRDFCFWCKFWAVVCLVFGFARREKQNQIKSQLSVVYRLDAGRRSCRSHEFPQNLLIVFAQFYVYLVFFPFLFQISDCESFQTFSPQSRIFKLWKCSLVFLVFLVCLGNHTGVVGGKSVCKSGPQINTLGPA